MSGMIGSGGGYGGYGIDPYGYGYGGYYGAYYDAAWQAFQNSQVINDQLVGEMQGIARQMLGLSGNITQEWENTFIPELNKLIADANSYASTARIQLEMGKAESQVAQAFDAQRQNALADLQSFGIDPSSGRYASLDRAERTQEAAAQAGAGNIAEQQTEAIARGLRSEAIQASANLPGYATSAAGVAAGALKFPPNPAYPPVPPQRPLSQNPINRPPSAADIAGMMKPGTGKPQVSVGRPGGNDKKPPQEPAPPQPQRPTPTGGKPPPNSSGSLPQPATVPQEGSQSAQPGAQPGSMSPDYNNAFNPGNNLVPDSGYNPNMWDNVPTDSSSWTAQPGDTVEGGAPSQDSVDSWNAPDTYDPYNTDPYTVPPSDQPPSNDPSGDTQDAQYDPSIDYQASGENPSLQDVYNAESGGGAYDNYGADSSDYGGDTSSVDNTNSNADNTDWNTYQDTGGDTSGDFSRGGAIPYSASPSRGRRTDDIRGRVRQTKEPINVDAGEFIMPRHAVAYKGKQFFQKIIDDSKKFHAKHGSQRRPQQRSAFRGAIPMR